MTSTQEAASAADAMRRALEWIAAVADNLQASVARDALARAGTSSIPAAAVNTNVLVYQIEEDEGRVHLSVGGAHIISVLTNSEKGIALLKLCNRPLFCGALRSAAPSSDESGSPVDQIIRDPAPSSLQQGLATPNTSESRDVGNVAKPEEAFDRASHVPPGSSEAIKDAHEHVATKGGGAK